MNKFLFFSLLLSLIYNISNAQFPTFEVNSSNNYAKIDSYEGVVSNNAYELKFTFSGTKVNFPNWKIAARITRPITSEKGNLIIPADKISLIPISTSGSMHSMPLPSIAQIGVNPVGTLALQSDVFLVPKSNVAFVHESQYNAYSYLQLHFNLKVEGGAYLESLQGYPTQNRYTMYVEFIAYSENGTIVGRIPKAYTIDIFKLSGTPPVVNQVTLQIAGSAKDALLELQTINDYKNGASVTYNNGLSVSSNTNYEVRVRSLNPQFNNISTSATLPLDIITLETIPSSSNHNSTPTSINLSAAQQKILEGASTQNQLKNYNIKYATKGGDSRLINTAIGQYRSILEYQIIPK